MLITRDIFNLWDFEFFSRICFPVDIDAIRSSFWWTFFFFAKFLNLTVEVILSQVILILFFFPKNIFLTEFFKSLSFCVNLSVKCGTKKMIVLNHEYGKTVSMQSKPKTIPGYVKFIRKYTKIFLKWVEISKGTQRRRTHCYPKMDMIYIELSWMPFEISVWKIWLFFKRTPFLGHIVDHCILFEYCKFKTCDEIIYCSYKFFGSY